MKVLSVYRTDESIIVERQNEVGAKFKRVFDDEKAMLEDLHVYKDSGKINEYELHVSEEFWALVINHLNS